MKNKTCDISNVIIISSESSKNASVRRSSTFFYDHLSFIPKLWIYAATSTPTHTLSLNIEIILCSKLLILSKTKYSADGWSGRSFSHSSSASFTVVHSVCNNNYIKNIKMYQNALEKINSRHCSLHHVQVIRKEAARIHSDESKKTQFRLSVKWKCLYKSRRKRDYRRIGEQMNGTKIDEKWNLKTTTGSSSNATWIFFKLLYIVHYKHFLSVRCSQQSFIIHCSFPLLLITIPKALTFIASVYLYESVANVSLARCLCVRLNLSLCNV